MATTHFEFFDEPVNLWSELLGEIIGAGQDTIRTKVLWGAHEQVQGIRDFSKASRLRLEKFLYLATSHGLSVELEVGFPAMKEAFPAWTYGLAHKALVPGGVWSESCEGYALVPLPSLFDPPVLEGFRSFLEDVKTLSSLYRKPEGAVSRVILDLGVLHFDLNALECPEFVETLERRHRTIGALNTLYQTTFKNFASVASRAGFRALMDRRPWIAAYDYQWCRREMLARACERFLGDWLEISPGAESPSVISDWDLAIDAILMEAGPRPGKYCFPFTPGGVLNSMAVASYRLGEYLQEAASREPVGVTWFSQDRGLPPTQASLCVVVSGKYLARRAMEDLQRFAESGKDVLFPWGLPQYDETMVRHPNLPAEKTAIAEKFACYPRGAGRFLVPAEAPPYGDDLWPAVRRFVDDIRERRPA